MKLTIELVPSTCWFSNVRDVVTESQWNTLRKLYYKRANYKCEICGGVGSRHPVECHEVFSYDDDALVQTLVDMVSLCPNCHRVKHIGFASIQGLYEKALNHLAKVNGLSKQQAQRYVHLSFDLWRKRSEYKWSTDLSLLVDLGIELRNRGRP